MIRIRFKDGTEKMLDECEVTISYTGETEGEVEQRSFDQVEKVMLLGPSMFLAPGVMGGMPVVGVAFRDEEAGMSVEVPMPTPFALDLAERLPVDVIEAERMGRTTESGIEQVSTLPAHLKTPPRMDIPRKRLH